MSAADRFRRGGLPAFAVRRPVTVAMLFVAVVTLGAVSFSRLPVDLMPAVDFPRLSVITEYPGVGPEEIETLITRPIEEGLATIQGVEKIQAMSAEGSSRVTLEFSWGTDLDNALADVRAGLERIRAQLPDDAEPPTAFKFDLASFPVMALSLSAEGMDQRRLRRLAEDRIKYRIDRVEGVARTDIRGGLEREIHVELDAGRLAALGIAPGTVIEVLRDQNRDIPGGEVHRGDKELILKTIGALASLEDLEETVVARRPEGAIRLSDVARVVDAAEERSNSVRVDGAEGLRLSVSKLAGANTIEVADRVLAEVDRINDDFPGVHLEVLRDTSEFIEDSVSNVETGALIGGVLAVLILFLFLRDLRATAIVAIAIPISVVGTFALMDLAGITLNIISFGGLALGIGMLVDNAIVILENIFRRREQGETNAVAASVEGSGEVASAVTASTLTTLAVFVPVVFMTGFEAIFFGQLAAVVAFSLVCALFVALTVVPLLTSRMHGEVRFASGGFFRGLEDRYVGAVAWALRHRVIVALSALVLLGGSCGAVGAGLVRSELMPEADQGEIDIDIELPTGTRLEITEKVVYAVEAIARREVPEADRVFSVVGPRGHWSSAGSNAGGVELRLRDDRTESSADIAARLRPKLQGFPDAKIRVRPGGGFWLLRMLRGGGERLQVDISGFELATGAKLAREVADIMGSVEGVADVVISRREGGSELGLRIDADKAWALGLSPAKVGETVQRYVLGATATWLREGGDEYRVLVRLAEHDRTHLEQLLDLPLFTPEGAQVPLRAVAEVTEHEGPIVIEREGQERVIYLVGDLVDERVDLGGVAREIQQRIREEVVVPPGFEVRLGGESREQAKTFGSLIVGLLLAIALVYMVMAAQFESLVQPFIIMFSVPFAAVGVVATLLVTGTSLNMNSLLGVIVLVGIVVNNSIVLVDYVNTLRRERGIPLADAVREGSRMRLRPVLMTTLTTVLALVPVALGVGQGGEMNAPLARVVAGGLATSALISLLIVPVVYATVEGRRERRRARRLEAVERPAA